MKNENLKELKIENANLIFKNFSGVKGPYNQLGSRTFSVKLDIDTAERLIKEETSHVRYQ